MQLRSVAIVFAILALTGCGGGGGDNPTPPPPPPPQSFLVSTQAGTGGSISPVSTSVVQGNSTSFSVTTNTGFSIDNVSGCGGSLSGSTYTTGAINAACTVSASFKKLSFNVSASGSAGGTITPVSQQILYGDTATINVKAESGFITSAVTGCNGQLQGEVYRTGAITADCKVEAVFAASVLQVTTQVSAGGKLSLQNPQVKFGETLQFTLLPDTGFDITTATGCGGKLSGSVFTTAPITAACTVEARFNPDHLVVFPDAQLDRVVRKALQLDASTPITKTQLAKLSMLYASSEGLTNLHGLQHAVGLRDLSVSYNYIVDITPLQGLSLLNWLNLTENPIIDIKPLSNLLALEVLDIFYIPTTDLTPLAGLKLTSVGLSNQAAFDLSPLQNMPISRFSMWSSATTDISVLADAPLQFLHLHESKVKDLSVLKNLSGLERVFVTGTVVVDLSPLQQAKRLSVLDMINTSLQDLTVLETLNFGNEAYVSISGCIDQSGYSRHLEQLNALKS